MKLTKSRLIKQTNIQLGKIGYHELKCTITAANVLYGKFIGDRLFLTLGLTISRYYDDKFTASFYLSKTTIWGAMWGDIPKNSYKRVGSFLSKDERKVFLSEEYLNDRVVDAWWDITGISNFISTVELNESRFLEQADLFDNIEKSTQVNELEYLTLQLYIELSNNDKEFTYKFIPLKEIDNIPMEWFKAAERVLFRVSAILNKNTVKRLAADAWLQNLLKAKSNHSLNV